MKLIGILLVFAATFGGLVLTAGMEKAIHLVNGVMLPAAPGETLVILGCGLAAFMIANSTQTIKDSIKYMGSLVKPFSYTKADYVELLGMLYTVFKLARSKGFLALESHVENSHESVLFQQFPSFTVITMLWSSCVIICELFPLGMKIPCSLVL